VYAKQSTNLLQIKVSIKNLQPCIWRRIILSDKMTLLDLHSILQAVFSWQDYHLHEFTINHITYGDPANNEFGDHPILDEAEHELNSLGLTKGSRFTYVYDFGDNWEHLLVVEKIIPLEKGTKLPRCIDGKRACPPEDVGGIGGYEEFLNILKDSQNEEYESTLLWAGGTFDSNAFDLNTANERLQRFVIKSQEWNPRPEYSSEGQFGWSDPNLMLNKWINQISPEDREIINLLPLRRDVVSLVTYIKEHRIKGTQSTGNFPRKAVQDIAKLIVNPPVMRYEFQDRTIEFKNEWDVRSIYTIHLLAYLADLIDGSRGKFWRITPKGEKFLMSSSVEQFYILFTTWWFKADWSNFPVSLQIKDGIEVQFLDIALTALLELPSKKTMEYSTFVMRIIELSGTMFLAQESDSDFSRIKTDFEIAIIEPLESFSVLSTERKIINQSFNFPELTSVRLTEIGQKILSTLKIDS
jgi:hypothetical protein